MSCDTVYKIDGATVQHGKANDRIYLMKLGASNPDELLPKLDELAKKEKYGKIFAKISGGYLEKFIEYGYQCEASVPQFYSGKEGGIFLGKYFKPERAKLANYDELEHILSIAKAKQPIETEPELDEKFSYKILGESDCQAASEVYSKVFPTYPFAIDDPDYLLETMRDNIIYFGIYYGEELVALSSAEMDKSSRNVEMTDFATLPDWRGNGFGTFLLAKMEQKMLELDIPTAYTIARAVSPGMNITFAKMGYIYGGRLINNTQISGSLESMNVWYKILR